MPDTVSDMRDTVESETDKDPFAGGIGQRVGPTDNKVSEQQVWRVNWGLGCRFLKKPERQTERTRRGCCFEGVGPLRVGGKVTFE